MLFKNKCYNFYDGGFNEEYKKLSQEEQDLIFESIYKTLIKLNEVSNIKIVSEDEKKENKNLVPSLRVRTLAYIKGAIRQDPEYAIHQSGSRRNLWFPQSAHISKVCHRPWRVQGFGSD